MIRPMVHLEVNETLADPVKTESAGCCGGGCECPPAQSSLLARFRGNPHIRAASTRALQRTEKVTVAAFQSSI